LTRANGASVNRGTGGKVNQTIRPAGLYKETEGTGGKVNQTIRPAGLYKETE